MSAPTSLVENANLESVFSFLRSLAEGAVGGEGLAESVRQKLLGIRDELCSRFGFAGDACDAEWPTTLVFALVASADFAEPPVVIHVVGAPGTAKTLGARVVSGYVEVPLLVLRFRGRGVIEAYRRLVAALARFLGVSEDALVNRVGGVVRWLHASRGLLEVRLSLPHLASYALRRPSGLEALEGFVAEARALCFEVGLEVGRPRYEVVDPAQQGNIDDYRFRVQPSRLGILTISDIFDNYVLVLDEGCRNLNAVGYLLTKMSAVSLLEGLRVVVITDNPESLFNALSDERLAPLHDRAVRVFSSELRVPGDLLREPSVRLNALELLAARKMLDLVEVPEEADLLLDVVKQSLRYRYAVAYFRNAKTVEPVPRGREADVAFDPFQGLGIEFVGGGRFEVHTKMLARFFAFLSGRRRVEAEDLWRALLITARSRIRVEGASSFDEYKRRLVEAFVRLRALFNGFGDISKRIGELVEAVKACDRGRAGEAYRKIIEESNANPFYIAAAAAALRRLYISRALDEKCLPESVLYTVLKVVELEGDIFEVSRCLEIYAEILDEERRSRV